MATLTWLRAVTKSPTWKARSLLTHNWRSLSLGIRVSRVTLISRLKQRPRSRIMMCSPWPRKSTQARPCISHWEPWKQTHFSNLKTRKALTSPICINTTLKNWVQRISSVMKGTEDTIKFSKSITKTKSNCNHNARMTSHLLISWN